MAPRAQEQDGRLVPDLHARAGDERDAAAEIDGRGAPRVVLVAACRAELVVEAVERAVRRLADVALARLGELGATLVWRRGRLPLRSPRVGEGGGSPSNVIVKRTAALSRRAMRASAAARYYSSARILTNWRV